MSDYGFSKEQRLRKRKDFLLMHRAQSRFKGRYVLVDLRQNKLTCSRLGITVSRKFGKSCRRNRFKRVVREAYRLSRHLLPIGMDFHIRPSLEAANASPSLIIGELLNSLHV